MQAGDGPATEPQWTAPDAQWEVRPAEEVWVTSSIDGKRLHNAVFRPDTDEPAGVFVNLSPYHGDVAMVGGDAFARYMVDEYVPRGFAVVLSSVRGTGHSEGCFQIGGDVELSDLHDVVDHFANAPWSNGRVAAGGKSYDSTTQNGMVAKDPHPALEGIFHVSGITDMYRYNYRNGVPYLFGTIFNTYYYGQTWHEYGLPLPLGGGSPTGDASPDDEDTESLARIADDAACTAFPEIQAHGFASAAAGAKTAYWTERDWNRFIGDSEWDGNVFFVHGFQDWNVKPDHIMPWLDLLPEHVERKVWLHQDTDFGGHVYPMRADWNETMLRWMDHTLNAPNGFFDGPAYDLEGSDGAWRHATSWPPAETIQVDATADGITITGPLRITGEAVLDVTAQALSADPVFSAVLTGPDGRWANEAVLRVVYRGSLETPTPVQPGGEVAFQVSFYPMDLVLANGESATIRFQQVPTQAVATEAQLKGLVVDAATLHAPVGPSDAPMQQPTATDCFVC